MRQWDDGMMGQWNSGTVGQGQQSDSFYDQYVQKLLMSI